MQGERKGRKEGITSKADSWTCALWNQKQKIKWNLNVFEESVRIVLIVCQ